jgi:uncharacterized protein YggT (Ycf19 family)
MATYQEEQGNQSLYFGSQVIWYILAAIETLLVIRFFLKLFSADATTTFTSFVYSVSGFFTAPFTAVINNTAGSNFEWTTLLAIAVYLGIAVGINELLFMGREESPREEAHRLRRQQGL